MVRSAWASPRRDEAPATPRHVLDLAESLQLSEEQRRHTQAIFEDMRAEAVHLGQQLIARERHLETLFATGTVAETMVEQLVANIATIYGQLRASTSERIWRNAPSSRQNRCTAMTR